MTTESEDRHDPARAGTRRRRPPKSRGGRIRSLLARQLSQAQAQGELDASADMKAGYALVTSLIRDTLIR